MSHIAKLNVQLIWMLIQNS